MKLTRKPQEFELDVDICTKRQGYTNWVREVTSREPSDVCGVLTVVAFDAVHKGLS